MLYLIDVSTGDTLAAIQNDKSRSAKFLNRDLIIFENMLYFQGKEHEMNISGPWVSAFVRDNTLYVIPSNSSVQTEDGYKYDIYATDLRPLSIRAKSARK